MWNAGVEQERYSHVYALARWNMRLRNYGCFNVRNKTILNKIFTSNNKIMSKINLTVEEINALKSTEIITDERVREKFVQIYTQCGQTPLVSGGDAAYERESRFFK